VAAAAGPARCTDTCAKTIWTDQRDRDKANVELSTLECTLLSMGTHIDKAVITAITPITYQSRMSSGERFGRLRLRIGTPFVDFPHAQNSGTNLLFRFIFLASGSPN
jgi:hypothetical protein